MKDREVLYSVVLSNMYELSMIFFPKRIRQNCINMACYNSGLTQE